MSKKRRAIEWGKTLLILALLVSAVLLGVKTGFGGVFDPEMELGAAGAAGDSSAAGSELPAAWGARPVGIAVCFEGGQRGAWVYDEESVGDVFRRFSAALGEALGSAGQPEEVGEESFRAALETEGVFLRLLCEQPLGLLSRRLGAEMSAAAAGDRADMLCLCVEGEDAALYYRAGTGQFFRCATAVNAEALQSRLSELQPNGAYFAYERESLAGLESYTLIPDTMPQRYVVMGESRVPGDSETETLFSVLGINSYVVSPYTESGGTRVYIDGEKTLRIGPSGTVSFRCEGGDAVTLTETGAAAAAEAAWKIAESALLPYSGAADLCLSGLTGEDGSYSLSFDYMIDGVPVTLSAGHAAQVTITNGAVTGVDLTLRFYTLTEETQTVLPALQAAAIVASGDSARLLLTYADSGESVDCKWVTD
ncbi:MAG: hypothetical protein ACI4PC_06490 [Oscillospiraceae bacterium]